MGRCLDQSDILIGLSCERDREVGPGMDVSGPRAPGAQGVCATAPRAGAPGRWVE
jgi:hypothetical protein